MYVKMYKKRGRKEEKERGLMCCDVLWRLNYDI